MNIVGLRGFQSVVQADEWGLLVKTDRAGDMALVRGDRRKTLSQADEYNLRSPRLWLAAGSRAMTAPLQTYARYLSFLLGVPLDDDRIVEPAEREPKPQLDPGNPACDLIFWAEPTPSWASQFLFGSPAERMLERVSTSLLITRQPCRPLRQILLVVRSEAAHGLAVNWAIRLAQASGAMVTVLVVVPLVSPLPDRKARQQQELATLLSGDGQLEQQIRYVSQRLEDEGLEVVLQLRQGSPEQQIRTELEGETYDLVIAAAESKDWWLRRLLGETVKPVLNRANCPVLIAKPGQA